MSFWGQPVDVGVPQGWDSCQSRAMERAMGFPCDLPTATTPRGPQPSVCLQQGWEFGRDGAWSPEEEVL